MAAACALILACGVGFAQKNSQDTTLREVQGTVTDSEGHPVEKAAVLLKDTKSLQIESFITDSSGHYHFARLSSDVEYQLSANHNGNTSGWKTLSLFNTKKIVTMNLKLNRVAH